jgi:hypothetical protein
MIFHYRMNKRLTYACRACLVINATCFKSSNISEKSFHSFSHRPHTCSRSYVKLEPIKINLKMKNKNVEQWSIVPKKIGLKMKFLNFEQWSLLSQSTLISGIQEELKVFC